MSKFGELHEHEPVISVLRAWGESHPEIQKIIVYGSRARGDHRPGSDFDVALQLIALKSDERPFDVWMTQAEKWEYELKPHLPWALHLEWYDAEGDSTPTVKYKIQKGSYLVLQK